MRTRESINRPHQFADRHSFLDVGVVLLPPWGQKDTEVSGGIAFGAFGRNRIHKYGADCGQDAVGLLVMTVFDDAVEDRSQIRNPDVRDGA